MLLDSTQSAQEPHLVKHEIARLPVIQMDTRRWEASIR
jgi:hypothetical protein